MDDPLAPGQFVWGVDIGVAVVTTCAVGPGAEPTWRQAHGVKGPSIAERLSLLGGEVRVLTHHLAEERPPACVMVEQPIRRFPNPHLDWACGVVSVALYEALAGLYEHPVPIWHMPVSKWRKAAIGKGSASKEECRAWAVEQTGIELDYDEADAYGIAQASLSLLEVR